MGWYIDPNINNGYPTNTDFPAEYITTWTGDLPHLAWRIQSGVNAGYPFIWYWFQDSSSGGSGIKMQIGGRQTNFPNGLHNAAASIIPFDAAGSVFNDNPAIGVFLASATKSYAATPGAVVGVRDDIIAFCQSITNTIHNQILGITGTGLTDIVIQAKIYPFDLPNDNVEPAEIELIRFSATDAFTLRPNTGATLKMAKLTNTVKLLDFGTLDLSITQGWEIDGIAWSIYLPYAGTYALTITGTEQLNLKCVVDIMAGQCEYYLLAGGEIIFSASGKMGVDIPFNTAQAAQMQNLNGWRANQLAKGISIATGSRAAGVVSAMIGSSDAAITAPSTGGGVGFATPQAARLIAHVPEMQLDGYGYADILGTRKQYARTRLADASGFVKCNNYKCEIIVATTQEKNEIEQLLNEGVFLS